MSTAATSIKATTATTATTADFLDVIIVGAGLSGIGSARHLQAQCPDGTSILKYLRGTARETGVDEHIRYRHRVQSAIWCSESATWTVTVQRSEEPEPHA